jgi:hypothetical protein
VAKVIRVDAGTLLRSPTVTPQGFLRVDGYVGRTGCYEYINEDGSTRIEYRPPDEVFKMDALASFEGAPLTDGHPMSPVTPDNVKHVEVGTVTSAARRDGEHVAAAMVVKDPKVIRKVKSGKQQLSPGYALDLDMTPGIAPDGTRYDAVQRNIEVNHLAIVDRARGGDSVRMRMDSADFTGFAVQRSDNELDAEQRNKIPDKDFADPEDEKEPLENAEHVRAAMTRFKGTKFGSPAKRKTAYNKIVRAAAKFDIDASGFKEKYGNSDDADYEMDDEADGDGPDPDNDGDDDEDEEGDDDKGVNSAGWAGVGKKRKAKKKRADWLGDWNGPGQPGPGGGYQSSLQLTSIVDGHQHTIDVTQGWNETSYALSEGDDASHNHAWVRETDGSITISENDGHTHTIEPIPTENAAATTTFPPPNFNMRGDQGARPTMATKPTPEQPNTPTMNHDEALRSLEAQLSAAKTSIAELTADRDNNKMRADSLKGELDVALKQIPPLKAELARVEAARETAEIRKQQARADAAERQVVELERSMKPRMKERLGLMLEARTHLGDAFNMDDLTDRQIMCSVIRHLDKSADVGNGVSEGEIVGTFKALTRLRADNARSIARVSEALAVNNQTDTREELAAKRRDAWKQPLPNQIRK